MSETPSSDRPASIRPDTESGLPDESKASFFLDAAWGYAQRGNDLSVVVFEIDPRLRLEGRFGPDAIAEVRRAFVRLLAERTRPHDLSAEYGSRFLTILVDRPRQEAERHAAEIERLFRDIPFEWGSFSVHSGVASIEQEMEAPADLLGAAERVLCLNRLRQEGTRPQTPGDDVNSARTVSGGLGQCRVLVVDDDEATLRSTRRMLERLGCEVTAAASSREALVTVTSDLPIDLLVTDIVMPEMSGFTLVEVASRARSDLSVLYVSGYPQEEVYWGGNPGPRSAFLGKPMEIADLESAVRALLGLTKNDREGTLGASQEPVLRVDERDVTPMKEGTILIVDDDEAVVGSLQRLFQRAGYAKPIGLTDPGNAAKIVSSEVVDLIILDLHMPAMNGFDVMKAISPMIALEEYLPVLILTGDDTPDLRRRALEAGAMDFLAKPFDPAEAEARVRNLLKTRHLTRRVADKRALLEEQVIERTSELADTRTEILHRLARAAEYRDDITGRHAERVGLLSSIIASELGWETREVDFLRRTAPLHDIGKIGIPDGILRKPGRLTPDEYRIVQEHTVIGASILGGSHHRILQMAARIARGHHERWDGLGYPDALSGDHIPAEARIVAVADVFDVLSHSRTYKGAVAPVETLKRIVKDRGTHFDPDAVDALQEIFDRVGSGRLMELVDPIDPSRDITPQAIAL